MAASTEKHTPHDIKKKLIQLASNGSLDELIPLLDQHPHLLDRPNSHGNTPLRSAVGHGHLQVAKCLVKRGSDPFQNNGGGWTLMSSAAFLGDRETVNWLRDLGLAVTELELSAINDVKGLEELLESGDQLGSLTDSRRQTSLHYAARTGALDALKFLILNSPNFDLANKNGHTPLAIAVEEKQLEVAKQLLEAGANSDCAAGHFGGTVLHRAIIRKDKAMVQLLLERGSDPNQQDAAGKTALHETIATNRKDLVELLLRCATVNLNLRTKSTQRCPESETPYEFALSRKKVSLANLILSHTP